MYILKRLLDIFIAFSHLLLLLVITLLDGINRIIFNAVEVINIQMVVKPSNSVTEGMSYISKLCSNNLDLFKGGSKIPTDAFDEISFKPDEDYEDDFEDDEDYPDDDECSPDDDDNQPPKKG